MDAFTFKKPGTRLMQKLAFWFNVDVVQNQGKRPLTS